MAGIEVSRDRISEFERSAWAEKFMHLIAENAQMRAANEALQGRIQEVEQAQEGLRRQVQGLTGAIHEYEQEAEDPPEIRDVVAQAPAGPPHPVRPDEERPVG